MGDDLNKERAKALEMAISTIEKQFGKGSIMRLGTQEAVVDTDSVPSGSLGLDVALGVGGIPRGRVVEIYGPESSGKTTLAPTSGQAILARMFLGTVTERQEHP